MVTALQLSLYPELKGIDPDLVDSVVIDQVEAQRSAETRAEKKTNIVCEVYAAIEEDNLDTLSFLGQDIGVLMKVRERFKEDRFIREYCEYLIRIDQAEMEQITEEIEDGRRKAKEASTV